MLKIRNKGTLIICLLIAGSKRQIVNYTDCCIAYYFFPYNQWQWEKYDHIQFFCSLSSNFQVQPKSRIVYPSSEQWDNNTKAEHIVKKWRRDNKLSNKIAGNELNRDWLSHEHTLGFVPNLGYNSASNDIHTYSIIFFLAIYFCSLLCYSLRVIHLYSCIIL